MGHKKTQIDKYRRSERGQSVVELAVSLTLILLILAATVDLGRAFFSFVAIREAAEEGALYGSFHPTDNAGTIQRVRTNSSSPVDLSDTSKVSVSVLGDACAGGTVRVTVTYQFNLTMPLIGPIIGAQSFPISASATTTILSPEC